MRKRLKNIESKKIKNKFPGFFSIRIVIVSLILFYLLTISIYLNIYIKIIIISLGNFNIKNFLDLLNYEEFKKIDNLISTLFNSSFLLALIFFLTSLPYKVYFYKKKKNLEINLKLKNFVKKTLVLTPFIFSFLFFFFTSLSFYLSFKYFDFQRFQSARSYIHGISVISILASFAISIFIFSWQNFRVQQYYINVVFDEEELRFNDNFKYKTSIKFKLFLSYLVTTFFPMLFLFFINFINLSNLNDIEKIGKNELKIIFGSFSKVIQSNNIDTNVFYEVLNEMFKNFPNFFNFYSSLDTLIMYFTIISSLISMLIYIFVFLRFNTVTILKPLNRLLNSMEKVSNFELNSYTYIDSNDEIGKLINGFNKMLVGLNEKEKIKELFGQYLTKEISDKIIKGEVHLEGELFDATVMFTDIRDFTKITQDISPVDTIKFLNEYFDPLINIVVKHGGIVDKFIGDGMMAVFGIPISNKDHATKALSCAIEMQNIVLELNEKRKNEGKFWIKMGIGIHSGKIIAGNIGNTNKLQYTVVGDTVNVASRIESLNKEFSSSILLSESTYNNLDLSLFDKEKFKLFKQVEIRGKSEKINLFSYEIY